MQIQIAGRKMDLGDALRARIEDGLEAAVKKYFDREFTDEKMDEEIRAAAKAEKTGVVPWIDHFVS